MSTSRGLEKRNGCAKWFKQAFGYTVVFGFVFVFFRVLPLTIYTYIYLPVKNNALKAGKKLNLYLCKIAKDH